MYIRIQFHLSCVFYLKVCDLYRFTFCKNFKHRFRIKHETRIVLRLGTKERLIKFNFKNVFFFQRPINIRTYFDTYFDDLR